MVVIKGKNMMVINKKPFKKKEKGGVMMDGKK
jgi:hypothetical protein